MEFVWKIVTMIVVLACVAIIAGVVNLIMNRRKIDPKVGKISFRESMDLVELPIVTFMNNGLTRQSPWRSLTKTPTIFNGLSFKFATFATWNIKQT